MKAVLTTAVFLLAAYAADHKVYDGKFSRAADEIASRMAARFR